MALWQKTSGSVRIMLDRTEDGLLDTRLMQLAGWKWPAALSVFLSYKNRPGRFGGDPACFCCLAWRWRFRASFRFLPPQHLSQGFYCLYVCLVQLWEQLGCCGFVAFPEGIVHAFRKLCTLVSERLPATPLRAWASVSAVARSPAANALRTLGMWGSSRNSSASFRYSDSLPSKRSDDVLVIYFGVLQRGNVFFRPLCLPGFRTCSSLKYNPGHDES